MLHTAIRDEVQWQSIASSLLRVHQGDRSTGLLQKATQKVVAQSGSQKTMVGVSDE
jgi:hypothetical protein